MRDGPWALFGIGTGEVQSWAGKWAGWAYLWPISMNMLEIKN